jgi:putative chitinase
MTPELKHIIAAGVKPAVAEQWLQPVQAALYQFEIFSDRQVAAWLAQCAHESGGFTRLEEDLNYKATTMAACWPKRFAEVGPDGKPKRSDKGALIPNKFALALERKPEALANVVYSGRMGNGPIESGEGWKFRGRGLKQLTGKDNVRRFGTAVGVDFVAEPDMLLQPSYAAQSAAWFWSVNKCGPLADADDFVGLTKKINGGTIGLEDRQRRYKAVLASIS